MCNGQPKKTTNIRYPTREKPGEGQVMKIVAISLIIGLCAAIYMHHVSRNSNYNGFTSRPTWKLVWVVFIGVTLFVYGVIAL